jgi:hypothetical protein
MENKKKRRKKKEYTPGKATNHQPTNQPPTPAMK